MLAGLWDIGMIHFQSRTGKKNVCEVDFCLCEVNDSKMFWQVLCAGA